MFFEILQNSQENICARVSFLIKLQGWRPATLLKKEIPTQAFSCEYCSVFKNNYLEKHPQTSACKKRDSGTAFFVLKLQNF